MIWCIKTYIVAYVKKKKRFIIIIINWIMDIHNLQLSVSNVDAWKAKKGWLWIHD